MGSRIPPNGLSLKQRSDLAIAALGSSRTCPEPAELATLLAELSASVAALSQENQKLADVLRAASEISMIATDRNGLITFFNRGAELLLGYTEQEMVGRQTPILFHLESEVLARSRELSAELGRPVEGFEVFVINALRFGSEEREWTYVRKDGGHVRMSLVATAKRDASGEITGYLGIARDITEREAMEETLRAAKAQAEEANRAKSEFLAAMSHEIRTPLNGVVGFSSLLLDTDLDAEQRDFADSTRNSAEALLSIVNDILDFSKIEAGRIDLEDISFDPREEIGNCLDIVTPTANRKRIEICSFFDEACPERIIGDVTRFRQVLTNLLSNAVKFTHRGEVAVTVEALPATATAAPLLRTRVRDTGIGISPAQHRRIFEPFMQGDSSTTRNFGGTGLGLAISRRLAEIMGGSIDLESAPGEGSTFTFNLPLRADHSAPSAAREDFHHLLAGQNIAVVDDNDTNRRYLSLQIESWGARVHLFASGQSLLDAMRGGAAFDLVLMDHHMPVMDGEETRKRMRELAGAADTPVLLLSSGQASSHDFPAGEFARVFTKPVNARLLRNALATLRHSESPARAPAPDLAGMAASHPLRILLAEDNPSNQKLCVLMLGKFGYRADVVGNGSEAVDSILARSYDVVLMDLQMPVMDGLEATRSIRRAIPGTHQPWIIALTAHAAESDRDLCLEAGMDDYLTKPLHRDLLVSALRRAPEHAVSGSAK